MKALEIIIRTIAGILLVFSIIVIAIMSSLKGQRDTLPKALGHYVVIMEDSSMAPTASEGALVILKETNPFVPGDIAACLMDNNKATIARILSIDGKTENVSVEVPYKEMANALGNPSISKESIMPDDPELEMGFENGTGNFRMPADRLMAKAVFISGAMGVIVSMYENSFWAFLSIAVFAVICIWPFRHKPKALVYTEQDEEGPWIE